MAKNKDKRDDNLEVVEGALSKTERFIEDNQNILIGIVLGIAVLFLAYQGYQKYIRAPRVAKAHSQSFMASKYFERDSLDLALYGDGDMDHLGFEEIYNDYRSTPSGNASKYYLGIIAYKQGNYEDAIDYLKSFDSDDILVSTMAIGVTGDAYMQLGDMEAALRYYKKAASKDENKLTSPAFLKKAGMTCELLGDYDQAAELYQKIDDYYPDSMEGRDIKKYIARATRHGAE